MKLSSRRVLLALALSSALLAVASAAGSRKMLAAESTKSAQKTESKDSAKHFGGGWGGSFGGDWGHPAYPHYDYHPAEYVPHGDHYHYVPSHYDFDAFGKRKLLSADRRRSTAAKGSVKPTESTPVANSAEPVKKTESAQKLESAQHGGMGGWGGHPSTPHYDYHAASFVPHGDHYHYVPSHYDFDAFGRKMLSTETTETVKKTDAVKSTEGQKSVQKTEKAEQYGTHHGYQFTDDPYQYSHNPYGYHTPGTIPAYGGWFGRKLMTTDSAAHKKHAAAPKAAAADTAAAGAAAAAAAPVTKKTESAQKAERKDQYGTDHGYQFTDDPYQYTSRYVDHPAEYVQHGDHVHYVPEHEDWYDANAAQHTPGTIPVSQFGKRKLMATEAADFQPRKPTQQTHNTRPATNTRHATNTRPAPSTRPATSSRTAHGTARRPLAIEAADFQPRKPTQQTHSTRPAINTRHATNTGPAHGTARRPLAVETVDAAKNPSKVAVGLKKGPGAGKKTGTKESAKQWGSYMAYHGAEYVPHGDHVHYVPDHYDQVYGTQVAPGVVIPGAPGSVQPAWGKRKLMAAETAAAAQTTKATEAVKTATAAKTADAAKANQKIEKAEQYPGQQYEYHPAEYVPHGDHYHYVPGHYDAVDPAYNNGAYENTGAVGSQVGSLVGGIIGAALGRR